LDDVVFQKFFLLIKISDSRFLLLSQEEYPGDSLGEVVCFLSQNSYHPTLASLGHPSFPIAIGIRRGDLG
jgi:hypothetical protein